MKKINLILIISLLLFLSTLAYADYPLRPLVKQIDAKIQNETLKVQEKNAIVVCGAIATGCNIYNMINDRYPDSLKNLTETKEPLIIDGLENATTSETAQNGYYYEYFKISDNDNFFIYAKPTNNKGRIFFVDKTIIVRLNNINGKQIEIPTY